MMAVNWFLGANTPRGFYSLYDSFPGPERGRFTILKGGPGCGKSSFMRHIAQRAEASGHRVERIWCSGDPASLDGIYLPELRVSYVDGTAPHVVEPKCPGAEEVYLDLSCHYDRDALEKKRSEIQGAKAAYQAAYRNAYRFLAAAGAVRQARLEPFRTPELCDAVRSRARGFIRRELTIGEDDREELRFLSAFTCEGRVAFWDTVSSFCERVCVVDNAFGLAPIFLEEIVSSAREMGLRRILCPSPMVPEEPEHLLLPELSLAFVTSAPGLLCPLVPCRHVRLDAAVPEALTSLCRKRYRAAGKLEFSLLREAMEGLREANALHADLETLYNPHVDFSSLYARAEMEAAQIS